MDLLGPFEFGQLPGPDLLLTSRPHLRIIPGKMSGEPHLAGSRITTQVAAALYEHIPDAGRIAGLYAGVDVRMFAEAIEFEHSLAADASAAGPDLPRANPGGTRTVDGRHPAGPLAQYRSTAARTRESVIEELAPPAGWILPVRERGRFGWGGILRCWGLAYDRGYSVPVSRRELVLGTLREAIKAAAVANKATSIALVGSVARGDDGPESDVDFLATFESGSSLFDLTRLQATLEGLLGGEVDVVSASGLKPNEYEGHRAMLVEAIAL